MENCLLNWAMNRGWKNVENDGKNLDLLKYSYVNKNVYVTDSASEDSESSGEHGGKSM